MKTYVPKKDDIDKKWWLVNAEGKILGRLATEVADLLRGKNKPMYTTFVDTGDFVIVINAEKIKVTGSKARTKPYDWYTYHPGGRKVIPYDVMIKKHPTRPIELAVRRMLPKSPLGRSMLTKLKAYAGPDHPHEAQQPQVYKKA